ncbi:glycosyltransferase [Flavobacterium frigoris]|uniref:Alpha-1,4-N-acetylgalactosamine transferase PglH n=1 Tax=Flavobacterium frigoris (strain PS1) TaxID=1086011 RepID=H7FM63_FLAFP|nr:glycosyltransferase [Flavobacterium frigoris]EIA10401.1 alpha-1,4-N-acetylgalactosamine transferase PglH [Flavobacterium frigoris PS1]
MTNFFTKINIKKDFVAPAKKYKMIKQEMRILQLIDSLEAGGAERMAVNYANALSENIPMSALVATRKEGVLKKQLDEKVSYMFLNKKHTVDLKSIFRLRSFVCKHKINIVHAHGTSFFIAVLLKLIYPRIKIIWHEHYGARETQSRIDNVVLFFSSIFFSSIFVVNHHLEVWVKRNLFPSTVYFIPNFAIFDAKQNETTFLRGNDERRIVCLANLKRPKNHFAILSAFKNLKLSNLGWSMHLIGKDYKDHYSSVLKDFIKENNLDSSVFIYGSKNDIQHILRQATIGILASSAEGFPVTILEYGLAKLPVVSTNVGYCSEIIQDNVGGLLFDPSDNLQIQNQILKIIMDKQLRDEIALELHKSVSNNYSKDKIIAFLLSCYKQIL